MFCLNGINFVHIKQNGMFMVVTSRYNISPSDSLQVLMRLVSIIRDFCGVMSEESIRKNFILVYEIIDEMIDFGYPQSITTDSIRPYIVNEANLVQQQNKANFKPGIFKKSTAPSTSTIRPVVQNTKKTQKNEIFVDVCEKITVMFNNSGFIINSGIEGCIQMKSYLSGNPNLRLALNEDLAIGK